jgi:restriction-modification enzyme MmeI-like protein
MNAVEIEEAISALAERTFDAAEFPFGLLEAFGNKETTIKRLRAGASNKSDLGGVLQSNNIHIVVCAPLEVTKTLAALKASPATAKAKARFILVTDGTDFEAEDLESGETVACAYRDFPDHFGFFLPLAGITTVKQVRESSFDIRATSGPIEGFDYGQGGYDPKKCNVGFNEETGQFQIEIKGLAEPKSKEAVRICQEDLNEVIAAFVQDKTAIERGIFDEELVPEELTQVRMGKIIKDKYPHLDEEDREAVRHHAIAALNLTQQAKQIALGSGSGGSDAEPSANTALIDGVRKFAMDVRELDIDLIDRINPFGEAYAILAKTMSEGSLKQVQAAIAAKRTSLAATTGLSDLLRKT